MKCKSDIPGSFFAFRGSVISWKFTCNQRFFVASDVENVWGIFGVSDLKHFVLSERGTAGNHPAVPWPGEKSGGV